MIIRGKIPGTKYALDIVVEKGTIVRMASTMAATGHAVMQSPTFTHFA